MRELKTDGLLPVETKLRSSKYLNNLIEQDHRGVKQRIAVMLGSRGPAMQRSRSPASSYCIALGGDSSDWDVSAFKIERTYSLEHGALNLNSAQRRNDCLLVLAICTRAPHDQSKALA